MGKLHEQAEEALRRMGLKSRPWPACYPIFYNASAGIRFEIWDGLALWQQVTEDAPIPVAEAVDQATDRAAELYDRLPSRPDILWLRSYRYAGEQPFLTKEQLLQAGLPQPDEVTELPDPEEEGGFARWLYWDLSGRRELIRPLLREIIRSDTAPDGLEWLTSSVYFCNQQLLYHLYDSRGADVAAVDREILRPLYENSREWILDYDRPAVDRLFEK